MGDTGRTLVGAFRRLCPSRSRAERLKKQSWSTLWLFHSLVTHQASGVYKSALLLPENSSVAKSSPRKT